MNRQGFWGFFQFLALILVFVTLGVYVFQMNTLEKRLKSQGDEIRQLGDGVDRLRAELRQTRRQAPTTATIARTDETPEREWLHPDAPNLLDPHDYRMTLPGVPTDGVLVRPYGTDPKGFNIITENAADLAGLIWTYCGAGLADRMIWTDPDKWFGQLAERIEVTDDYKEFTIYLRPGVKWHKPGGVDLGDPRYAWLDKEHLLTADDVKFSLDIMMHPQVENGFIKNYYEDLDSWEVVDEHTIIVRWKRKLYGNVENTLSLSIIPEFLWAYDEDGRRFPEETMGVKFNQHWYNSKGLVGAGPYRMTAYESGVQIRLERNEDYYGELPAIKELVYPIYSDPDQTLLRLKAHTINFGGLRPSQYVSEIKRWQDKPKAKWPGDSPFLDGRIHHKTQLLTVYYYIGWNADKPMFADKRVRRAMGLAFNRAGVLDNVFHGLGQLATGPFWIKSPYNDPDIAPLPFDLGAARELLAEAGWKDTDGDGLLDKDLDPDDNDDTRRPFEFSLLIYGTSPEWTTAANIYKEDLLKVGVRLKIEAAEWSLMQKKMNEKEFDAFTGGWGLTWDPDPYQLWHSSQADLPKSSNRVGFRNKEADAIIEELRVTFDKRKRVELFHRFHRILYEEQPYTFFYAPEAVVCWWDEVNRVEFALTRPQTCSLPWWVETR